MSRPAMPTRTNRPRVVVSDATTPSEEDLMRKILRLAVLIAAVVVLVHILVDDDRSNWLALLPGFVLAAGLSHMVAKLTARRQIA